MVVLAATLFAVDLRTGHTNGGSKVFPIEEVMVRWAGKAALLWVTVVRSAVHFGTGRAVPCAWRSCQAIQGVIHKHVAEAAPCTTQHSPVSYRAHPIRLSDSLHGIQYYPKGQNCGPLQGISVV